jgi:hypothetical protein
MDVHESQDVQRVARLSLDLDEVFGRDRDDSAVEDAGADRCAASSPLGKECCVIWFIFFHSEMRYETESAG